MLLFPLWSYSQGQVTYKHLKYILAWENFLMSMSMGNLEYLRKVHSEFIMVLRCQAQRQLLGVGEAGKTYKGP